MGGKSAGKWVRAYLLSAVVLVLLPLSASLNPSHSDARSNQDEIAAAEGSTTTVYLPLVARYHDPSWVAPFGTETRDYQLLPRATEAQMRWIHVGLRWDEVEPTEGSYNWAIYDDGLAKIAAAGLTPIVLIEKNPNWAAATDCGPLYDNQDLVRFLTTAVGRYKDSPYSVEYWEIYNEPDMWRSGTVEKAVLWTASGLTRPMGFPETYLPYGQLRVVDKYGAERILTDGTDDSGREDGLVTVTIGPSPIYVEAYTP